MVMAIKVIRVVTRTPIIKMMGNTTINMKDIMTINITIINNNNNNNLMEEKAIMMNRKSSPFIKTNTDKNPGATTMLANIMKAPIMITGNISIKGTKMSTMMTNTMIKALLASMNMVVDRMRILKRLVISP